MNVVLLDSSKRPATPLPAPGGSPTIWLSAYRQSLLQAVNTEVTAWVNNGSFAANATVAPTLGVTTPQGPILRQDSGVWGLEFGVVTAIYKLMYVAGYKFDPLEVSNNNFSVFVDFTLRTTGGAYDVIAIGQESGSSMRMCSQLSAGNWGTYGGTDRPASSALSATTRYRLAMYGNNQSGAGGVFTLNAISDGTWPASQGGSGAVTGLFIGTEPIGVTYQRMPKMTVHKFLVYDSVISGANLTDTTTYMALNNG